MAKVMKYHPHGSVLFCTFSLEEGLLLLSNPLCSGIVKSCLARAQELYPVKISHFLIEANHVHMVIVVVNPDNVPAFMRYFKAESAHMLNNLLGRSKRTVWCEGYDSPIVLTPTRALVAITYLYSNPAKDNLETSISRYPGLSSWKMFTSGQTTRIWKRLRRSQFSPIPKDANNLRGYLKLAERIVAQSNEALSFTLEPNAWMEAFGIASKEDHERINRRILARLQVIEERVARQRELKNKRVLGRERLISQVFDTTYRSKRSGRRMWCLSEKRSVRVRFIIFLALPAFEWVDFRD